MQTFNIARGRKISAECKNHSLEWSKIVDVLSTHKLGADKKDCGYFVGGVFANNYRNADNMVSRSMVTIDVDTFDGTGEDVLRELEHSLPYTLLAYSTFSSRYETPKFRIVIPLLHEIPAEDYEPLCKALADEFKEFVFDPCAFKPELAMYMPSSSKEGIMDSFSYSKTVEFLDINDFDIERYRSVKNTPSAERINDDFEELIKYKPLDFSEEAVVDNLAIYKAAHVSYDDWVKVGRALHHQYEGHPHGYDLWFSWSALDVARFKEDELLAKWVSFDTRIGSGKEPLTFATVVKKANEIKVLEIGDILEYKVTDSDSLHMLGVKLFNVPLSLIPKLKRQEKAKRVYDEIGKAKGWKLDDIQKVLTPPTQLVVREGDCPSWAVDWIYIETRAKYHNVVTNYEISKEAFNTKFSGESECKNSGKTASQLMITIYQMKTVVDIMYWPTAGQFFEYEGKPMLNSYQNYGIIPCDGLVGDKEGQRVVRQFLAHVDLSFNDEREKTIMLDWMCHVVQRQGERINWALLLQGSQGTGKSYFSVVMELIMGRNAQKVTPAAIMGRFSSWATGSVLNIVEEIYVAGNNKYELMNKIKDYIRNDVIQIEEKGHNHRNVPNFASYLFFSNHPDALAITEDERGFCIIYGAIQSKEQLNNLLGGAKGATAYFDNLFDNGIRLRPDAIAHYLMTRKISADFNHKTRAPSTSGRDGMINLSKNPEVEHIEDLIEKYRCPVINENIIDITYLTSCIKLSFDTDGLRLPSQKMMQHILHELNYRRLTNRINITNTDGTRAKHSVWRNVNVCADSVGVSVKDFHKLDNF